ncbi:MAG: hypothetical protein IPM82_06870 [Saprospiraceae bacterium]|nr:hypothetical protein [Saprospiraceae bacterium]
MKIINSILVPTDFSACAENAYHFSLRPRRQMEIVGRVVARRLAGLRCDRPARDC